MGLGLDATSLDNLPTLLYVGLGVWYLYHWMPPHQGASASRRKAPGRGWAAPERGQRLASRSPPLSAYAPSLKPIDPTLRWAAP